MKKRRTTKHKLALTNPTTRQKFGRLGRYWERWDAIKRGDLLIDLKERGCTPSGLARDLHQPGTTIRRYMMLASMPPDERTKFKEGETAKTLLARKTLRDRQQTVDARFAEEKKTGALSDEVAEIILEFLLSRRGVPRKTRLLENQIPTVLDDVRKITRGGFSFPRPARIKLPRRITLVGLYRMARPVDYPGEFELAHRAGWLSNILMAVAPELLIRERAISKAEERSLKDWEIVIRPDLGEVWTRRLKSLLKHPAQTPAGWFDSSLSQ